MGHGYAYTIAGRLGADYPLQGFKFLNRGVSGDRVSDIYNRLQRDILDLKPDVLSILVGVNDVGKMISTQANITAESYERIYHELLETVRQALPTIRLVLCEPFILPVGSVKANWPVWSEEMARQRSIVRQLADQYDAIHVPLQCVFDQASATPAPEYWIWDGVHPMPAGHELIARAWLRAVFPDAYPDRASQMQI